MRVLELRGEQWTSVIDFYDAVGRAQYDHDGRAVANICNINGLLELLIWDVRKQSTPPYAFRVLGASSLPEELRQEIAFVKESLADARRESIRRRGFDVEVDIETAD